MASPLIFSGDMGRVDDFMLNVLCNNEVIDINQDLLGKQGRVIREGNNEMIMVKELEDGSLAVGLFHVTVDIKDPSGYLNWGEPVKINVTPEELGLSGSFKIRDVWKQQDLGEYTGKYEAEVPYHGVKLVRIYR
jgi:alpha-galactosidase